MQKLFVAAILSALLGVPLAAAGNSHASGYPSSIAVLGTPTAAGWGAEAAHPFRDAPPDSRATGTNPTDLGISVHTHCQGSDEARCGRVGRDRRLRKGRMSRLEADDSFGS
jgi:hypothetical protein